MQVPTRLEAAAMPAAVRHIHYASDLPALRNLTQAFPVAVDAQVAPVAGSLLLDTGGTILSCTSTIARMCGANERDLAGRHIRSLVPALPMHPRTEGYNVAFVAFTSARGPRPWMLAAAGGRSIEVEGSLALLKNGGQYFVCVDLRPAGREDERTTAKTLSRACC